MIRVGGAFAWLLAGCGPADLPVSSVPLPVAIESVEPVIQSGDLPIYTMGFEDAHAHMIDVELVFPDGVESSGELMMAVWTPGSYLVREYSRNVEGVEAFDVNGESIEVEKTSKNRWHIGGARRVRYRLYARDLSVQNNFVDASMAVLNGAPTYLVDPAHLDRPSAVFLDLPDRWPVSVTQLDAHPDGAANHFVGLDFDALIDAPILAGDVQSHAFDVNGVAHTLANIGESGVWDGPRSADDVERIVQEQADFWGLIPYARYDFLNVIAQARGGLEHKASTLMLTSRWKTHSREDYVGWLGLVSHEFFHTWNVKRLRPEALGPFDYETEVYTPDLWIAEGLTSYYDDLILRRAGLMTHAEYLQAISKAIDSVQTTEGRHVRSLQEASFDAWIKHYRPDENLGNTSISYYRKGAVVGFLLDAEIRRVTTGTASLDDVMRLMYQRHSGDGGYASADFLAAVDEVAGESFAAWFAAYVEGTSELDYAPALAWYGLAFPEVKPAKEGDDPAPGWLGVRASGNPIVVHQVDRSTPAWDAGINVDDELIAFGKFRISSLDQALATHAPGSEVELLISRRGQLQRLSVVLAEAPAQKWILSVAEQANGGQGSHLRAWLGPDSEEEK